MVLGKLFRVEMVVIGENIAHLGHIIADCHGGISFGFKKRGQLQQIILRRFIEGNGARRVFF